MQSVASCSLGDLHCLYRSKSVGQQSQVWSRREKSTKNIRFDSYSIAGDFHDRQVSGAFQSSSERGSGHTLITGDPYLNTFSFSGFDQKRNQSAVQKIRELNTSPWLVQLMPNVQDDMLQVRLQLEELLLRNCGEEDVLYGVAFGIGS